MSSQKETIKLLIKIQYKNVENLKFKCPLKWSFGQIKAFIFMAHKSKLFEQIEREKFELLYAGQSLDLGDTMEDLLENLYQYYEPLVFYLHPNSKDEKALEEQKLKEEAEKEFTELQKTNLEEKMWRSYDLEIKNLVNYDYQKSNMQNGFMNHLPLMHKTIQKTIKNTVKKKRKFDTIPIQPPAPAPNAANLWRGWRFPFNLGFLFRVGLMLFIFGPYLLSGWLIASAIGLFILYTFLMRHQHRRIRERQQQQLLNPLLRQLNQVGQGGGAGELAAEEQGQGGQQQQANQRQPTIFHKIYECAFLFVVTFLPEYDINIYIEDNPVPPPVQENQPENPQENQLNQQPEQLQDEQDAQKPLNQDAEKDDEKNKKFLFKKIEDQNVANILNQFFEDQKEDFFEEQKEDLKEESKQDEDSNNKEQLGGKKEDGKGKDDDGQILERNINIENMKDQDLQSIKSKIENAINELKQEIKIADIPQPQPQEDTEQKTETKFNINPDQDTKEISSVEEEVEKKSGFETESDGQPQQDASDHTDLVQKNKNEEKEVEIITESEET